MTHPITRSVRHLMFDTRSVRRLFPAKALAAIEERIGQGEKRHSAEVRFVIEASLGLRGASSKVTPRHRALAVFSNLRVWDTEANNGVMLYVLLADHAVELIADRAAARAVPAAQWQQVCAELTRAYRAGDYLPGTLAAIDRIHELLVPAFPPRADDADELPNRPTIL